MFSSCEDPDEEKPSERNISKKLKYFPVSFYCVLTWRKSSQSHSKARDIMFSLIVNLDFDGIQRKSHITFKQAFEKLWVPTHGQSKLNWPCTLRVLCLRCREESHVFCFKSTHHHHNYICYPPVITHAEQIFNSPKNISYYSYHCATVLSRSESFPVNVDNRKWKWTQISTKCETMFNWNFSALRANLKVEHLWRNQNKIFTNSEPSVKTKWTLKHFSQCWWKIEPWHDSVGSLILTPNGHPVWYFPRIP